MTLLDILLLLCMAGGVAGIIYGASRRDYGTALLGVLVLIIAAEGLS
jgi:hypothetical protein